MLKSLLNSKNNLAKTFDHMQFERFPLENSEAEMNLISMSCSKNLRCAKTWYLARLKLALPEISFYIYFGYAVRCQAHTETIIHFSATDFSLKNRSRNQTHTATGKMFILLYFNPYMLITKRHARIHTNTPLYDNAYTLIHVNKMKKKDCRKKEKWNTLNIFVEIEPTKTSGGKRSGKKCAFCIRSR